MIAARKVNAEVAVHKIAGNLVCGINPRINRFSRRAVKLQQEKTAGPGAVGHVKLFSVRIEKQIRIDRIRCIEVVPASGCIKPAVADLVNSAALAAFFNQRREV